MRILHVYKTYYPDTYGGIEQVIYQLCHGCAERGIRSDVFTFSHHPPGNGTSVGNHQVIYNQTTVEIASTPFSLQALTALNRIKNNYDIIHYHFPFPFMDALHLLSRPPAKTVVTYHSDIIKQKHLLKLYQPLQNYFLHRVDSIITSSPNYLATSKVLQQFKEKTTVIPFGLKPAVVSEDTNRIRYWQQKTGGRFFLFVGAFRYYKGLDTLLEAAALCRLPVVIAGAGPLQDELQTRAERLHLSNLIFAGRVSDDDKHLLYQLCYGVVFPSHLRSEAFGISLLEGAQFCRPLISCEIGTGTSYINLHGETGLVVAPGDSRALSGAMQQLWEDPAMARRYGENAGKRFSACFTAERMIDAYIAHYRRLAGEASRVTDAIS